MKSLYFTIAIFSLIQFSVLYAQDSIFIDDQNMIAVEVVNKTNDQISFRELGKEDTFTLALDKISHIYENDEYTIYYLPSEAAKNHHLRKINPGIEIKINAAAKDKMSDSKKNETTSDEHNEHSALSDADQIKAEKEKIKQQIIQAIKASRFQQNKIVLITNQGKVKGRMVDISEEEIIVVSGRSIDDYHQISYTDIEKLQIRIMGKNRFVPGLVAASFGGMAAYYALKITIEGDHPSEGFQMAYLNNMLTKATIIGSYVLGARSTSRRYHFNISHSQSYYSDFVNSMEKAALK